MWKYEVSNTDHTLMQGVELINRLMLGEAETTIGLKYESTLDGRNAARHDVTASAVKSKVDLEFGPQSFDGYRLDQSDLATRF